MERFYSRKSGKGQGKPSDAIRPGISGGATPLPAIQNNQTEAAPWFRSSPARQLHPRVGNTGFELARSKPVADDLPMSFARANLGLAGASFSQAGVFVRPPSFRNWSAH